MKRRAFAIIEDAELITIRFGFGESALQSTVQRNKHRRNIAQNDFWSQEIGHLRKLCRNR